MCGFQLVIIIITLNFIRTVVNSTISSHVGLTAEQIVRKYGYPFESHTVQTPDGYLLTLHRIPYGVKSTKTPQIRPPVLLIHGFVGCSADFVVTGPEKALSFLLADAGYDVWLGNHRGTTWSRKHSEIDPDQDNGRFFNFTLHELGTLDLTAKIDYVLELTHQKSLVYIGHSQGTTVGFILLAERPEYNAKVKMLISLGTLVYIQDSMSPVFYYGAFLDSVVVPILDRFNYYEYLPHDNLLGPLNNRICSAPVLRELCALHLFSFCGFDSPQFDRDLLPVIYSNDPAGSSIKQVAHYGQLKNSDYFSNYNYGIDGNLVKYGQEHPPTYDLSQITTSVILHYSQNDLMAPVEGIEKLANELPNAQMKLVPLSSFNHMDYIYATDVVELLYKEIITEIKSSS